MAKYNEKIQKDIKNKGLKKTWIAAMLRMRYATFWEKMKHNKFTKDEQDKINILVGEDSDAKTNIIANAKTKAAFKLASKSLA